MRCGGTLAKYRDMGYGICYVMCTNNTAAGLEGIDGTPALVNATRARETNEAAAILGVTPIYLNYKESQMVEEPSGAPELFVRLDFKPFDLSDYPSAGRDKPPLVCAPDMPECVDELADIMVKYEPELILTHCTSEQNAEHWSACMLTLKAYRQACERVSLGNLYSWYYDTNFTLLYTEDVFVDISDYIGVKLEMLRKHVSQGMDVPEPGACFQDRIWGASIGVRYAERFRFLAGGRGWGGRFT